jgi:putative ATP-binding cassette transporter
MVARGLLPAVIALDLGKVYISTRINAWNHAFYNALHAFNSGEIFRQLGTFCVLVAFAIAMSVYALYHQPDGADTLAAMADA